MTLLPRAGRAATKTVLFGPAYRYAVFAIHTGSNELEWIIEDTEKEGFEGVIVRIRRAKTYREAVRGLEGAPKTAPVLGRK